MLHTPDDILFVRSTTRSSGWNRPKCKSS